MESASSDEDANDEKEAKETHAKRCSVRVDGGDSSEGEGELVPVPLLGLVTASDHPQPQQEPKDQD